MEEREKDEIVVISSDEEDYDTQSAPSISEKEVTVYDVPIQSIPEIEEIKDSIDESKEKSVIEEQQSSSSSLPPELDKYKDNKKTETSDLPPIKENNIIDKKDETKKTYEIPQSYDYFQKDEKLEDGKTFEQVAKEIIYYKPGSDKIPEKIRQRERHEIAQDSPWAEELKRQKEAKNNKNNSNENNQKNQNKIKYNKFSKIMMFILIASVVMNFLLSLLQFSNANFSNYMWTKVNYIFSDMLYKLMENFHNIVPYTNIIILVISLIIIIVSVTLSILFKKDLKKLSIFANIIMPFIVIFALTVNINTYLNLSDMTHRGINEIYLKDNMNKQYTQEDLENVIDFFKSRIILYAESLNRIGNKIDVGDPYELAVNDLKNLAVKYEFLKGSYPSKVRELTSFDLKNSNSALGLTFNYTVGVDSKNLSEFGKIFTLTHEFCHVKGIIRESDTDYCAFIAAYNSNSDISKYSMYVSLLPNLLHASKNEELNNNIVNELGTICIESGYDELCNLYYKDINNYIDGSDKIEFFTYSLDVYKKKKEELKQYFVGLKNRFNITIKDETGKEYTLEEANALIDKSEEISLHLIGNITEEKFNENTKYLNTVSDYFAHLYLTNSSDKDEEDYSNFDYLKPNPTSMFATLTEKYPEFDYDRAVRSILEYFDKYIIN